MTLINPKSNPACLAAGINIPLKKGEKIIALAGNPNTGKSTVFNALTGLNQHTGNWPGKTVLKAQGRFVFKDQQYLLVDLPGTYSLLARSVDEEVARDFLCFAAPDATIVVADATSLERNLNLALQVMEITSRVVLCLNMMDEAERKKIHVNVQALSGELGIPVVPTAAREERGLDNLKNTVHAVASRTLIPRPRPIVYPQIVEEAVSGLEPRLKEMLQGQICSRWVALRLLDGDESLLNAIENNLDPQLSRELKLGLFKIQPTQDVKEVSNAGFSISSDQEYGYR